MAGKRKDILKAIDIPRLTSPGKHFDGDGLYLVVSTPTARHWSFRYWINGKERWHGLGSLKALTLSEARVARDDARQRVRKEGDIVEAKKIAKQAAKAAAAPAVILPTFKQCAEEYIREHEAGWSEKHRAQWPSSLEHYAYPTIGALTIPEIKPSHIHDLLEPIWLTKRETSNRVRGRIETIIAKNVNIDDHDFRNPAELTKQLREKLPKRPKLKRRHHPALPYADAPTFMVKLQDAAGIAAAALQFLILTACRTSEVLGARWEEIDRPQSVWRIPGSRMKMGEDHSVPLTAPALEILKRMEKGRQNELIFPASGNAPFSDMAMLAVLKRMNCSHITVHGFRACFATWAEECTDYPDGVREAALAHRYKDETVTAYQRGEKLEKRRKLMNDWASYILPTVTKLRVVS